MFVESPSHLHFLITVKAKGRAVGRA